MSAISIPPTKDVLNAENATAALLSVVPGLGHIYKGHFAGGFLWMFVGMPLAIWIGILLGLATAGVGLLFPLLCWAGLAIDAYLEQGRRSHHWFPPLVPRSGDDDELGD